MFGIFVSHLPLPHHRVGRRGTLSDRALRVRGSADRVLLGDAYHRLPADDQIQGEKSERARGKGHHGGAAGHARRVRNPLSRIFLRRAGVFLFVYGRALPAHLPHHSAGAHRHLSLCSPAGRILGKQGLSLLFHHRTAGRGLHDPRRDLLDLGRDGHLRGRLRRRRGGSRLLSLFLYAGGRRLFRQGRAFPESEERIKAPPFLRRPHHGDAHGEFSHQFPRGNPTPHASGRRGHDQFGSALRIRRGVRHGDAPAVRPLDASLAPFLWCSCRKYPKIFTGKSTKP